MVSYHDASMFFLSPTIALLAVQVADAASYDKENEVKIILQRMKDDAFAFRDEMERVYQYRCHSATHSECAKANYNDCSSIFPNQQCMDSDELVVSACGDGTSCNALWDKTQTVVRIPWNLAQGPQSNPADPDVIESVCYSRLAEPYMVNEYSNGDGNQMYFGSSTGAFRIIPGRHSEVCGEFDPRRRPWFVAASSGPKDVVLVVDTSASMEDYGRMMLAKEAATTIVDTLTVADRVAIVTFSDTATQVGGQTSLIRATKNNKELLIDAINNLEASGSTNFYDAFNTTFNAIDETIRDEATTGCNIAVLFMTDGQITTGPKEEEVIDFVNEHTARLAADFNRKTTIFTFSLGSLADHRVTKTIACSTNGIWTPVDDMATDDLVAAMSSYYKLYALGLGEGGNDDFAAWVEPYEFHTAKKMGTSVSVPVYDRSVNPHHFLGVATVDMYMDDLEQILGEDASSSAMLDRFILLSTASCPRIELSEYQLDALRYLGGGERATCGATAAAGNNSNSTTDNTEEAYAGILPKQCPDTTQLPKIVWHNMHMEGKEYKERACCEKGGVVPSDTCPNIVDTLDSPDGKGEGEDEGEGTEKYNSVEKEPDNQEEPVDDKEPDDEEDPSLTGEDPDSSKEEEGEARAQPESLAAPEESATSSINIGMIVGVVVAAVVAVGLAIFSWRRKIRKEGNLSRLEEAALRRLPSSVEEGISIVMPPEGAPSAPPFNPAFKA